MGARAERPRRMTCPWCGCGLLLRRVADAYGFRVWRWCHPAGRRAQCRHIRDRERTRALAVGIRRLRADRPFLPFCDGI